MRVADVELTGSWEKTLAQVEGHTLGTETFMQSIRDYTRRTTEEILRLEFPTMQEKSFTCPKCKTGKIILRSKVARCDHDGCGLLVFRRILNKELTDTHMEQLFSSGTTRLIKGFKGKKGVRPSGFRGKSSSRRSGIFPRKPCLWRRYASRPLKLEKTVSPVNTGMS